RLFPDTTFEHDLRIVDASESRLDRLAGNQWVACGDAALSFDPISAQGLFGAIHGGMTAGRSVDSALRGGSTTLASYGEQLEKVWLIYSKRVREIYRSETRWPSSIFWSTFNCMHDELAKSGTVAGSDERGIGSDGISFFSRTRCALEIARQQRLNTVSR